MPFLKEDTYKQIQDMTRRKNYALTIGMPPEHSCWDKAVSYRKGTYLSEAGTNLSAW